MTFGQQIEHASRVCDAQTARPTHLLQQSPQLVGDAWQFPLQRSAQPLFLQPTAEAREGLRGRVLARDSMRKNPVKMTNGGTHLQLHPCPAAASLLVAALEQLQAMSNVVPSLGKRQNPSTGSDTCLKPARGTHNHVTHTIT